MSEDLIPIQNMIYEIRGQRVMLDRDIAMLYEVETKNFNRAIKRNINKFPSDFMFQLTDEETNILRCQFGTSSSQHGGRRYNPYVFTEHGILMTANVLNSEKANTVSVEIVRVFIKLRNYAIEQSAKPTKEIKIEDLYKMLMLHMENNDLKFSEQDKINNKIIQALNNLIEQPKPSKRQIGFTAQNENDED